ncbi:SDR family oxidoreductase [Streptomyces sp. NPDC005574]|uniref:SDR family oxidoreductase n=1 Tax=Streptomyces sp. NPDC005574 TaxID=3156891 RepID=UPI0033A4A3EB
MALTAAGFTDRESRRAAPPRAPAVSRAASAAGPRRTRPPSRRASWRACPSAGWGAPRGVAVAVAFLASADGSFVVGATLYVDGGEKRF